VAPHDHQLALGGGEIGGIGTIDVAPTQRAADAQLGRAGADQVA
jgi:hypothetical protein